MSNFNRFKRDEKTAIMERAGWVCEVCGQPAQTGERGHIIRQSKENYASLGKWFIDCALNIIWVHRWCNSKADRGNSMGGRKAYIERVVAYLENHPDVPEHVVYDSVTKIIYYIKGE